MTQYAIVTDLNRCVGCLACAVACKVANNVPIGSFWNKVLRIGPNPSTEGSDFPNVDMYFLPIQCQHCENPACVAVCPTGASHKLEDGTVQVDKEKCTLCEQKIAQGELPQCVAQCGGRARFFGDLDEGLDSFEAPEIASGNEERSYEGLQTVRATLGESIEKGYMRSYESSDVYHLPDVGNRPSLLYILRDATWQGEE